MGCTAMGGLGMALGESGPAASRDHCDGDVLDGARQLATIGPSSRRTSRRLVCIGQRGSCRDRMQPTRRRGSIRRHGKVGGFKQVVAAERYRGSRYAYGLLHNGDGPLFIHASVGRRSTRRIITTRDAMGEAPVFSRRRQESDVLISYPSPERGGSREARGWGQSRYVRQPTRLAGASPPIPLRGMDKEDQSLRLGAEKRDTCPTCRSRPKHRCRSPQAVPGKHIAARSASRA